MQRVLAVGAAEQQALVRSVLGAGMPTPGTGLTARVGIDPDSHSFALLVNLAYNGTALNVKQ
jgi:hypothetical protein